MSADKQPPVGSEALYPLSRSNIEEMIGSHDLNSPRNIARLAMVSLLDERRVSTPTCPPSGICEECIEPHVAKLTDTIEDGKPIQLILLAFPFKSPNPSKVLGTAPDKAESISLQHLHSFTERIRSFYEPGAEVVIGADGRIFADQLGVSDETVTAYVTGIRKLIQGMGLSISYFSADELMPEKAARMDYDAIREAITDDAVSIDVLRQRARDNADFEYQVNGIARFLTEDLDSKFPDISKRQLIKIIRERAYNIIRRGDVLRRELETRFPGAARLSVHPQTNHSGKLGVHITPSRHDWVTPWHAAAVEQPDGSYILMKRRDAEAQGATVVTTDDGAPNYLSMTSQSV